MSSIVVAGDTSGTCTLQAPAVAGSTVLTLPATTGTLALYGAPQVTVYTTGTGTYTVPTGAKWLQVKMVGGGGGGGGGNNGGNGGTGGNTTFGTSLLTANGGGFGYIAASGLVGYGGSATIASPTIGINLSGGQGACGGFQSTTGTGDYPSVSGGNSAFGGGGGGQLNQPGQNGATNTGAGAAGGPSIANVPTTGGGGGAGGYIEAYITSSLASTYSYAVGAGGSAGTAGTNGYVGGAGGSGIIYITAYFG